MEETNIITIKQRQVRSPWFLISDETQRENEEGFDQLQSEMATLKMLMEKLLEQNGERNRQVDATSSI